jgi:hypothetical protein
MSISPGEVVSHTQMCAEEQYPLQKGMNYRVRGKRSIFLMSLRANAPYQDSVMNDGKVLIYEGHDANNLKGGPDPKSIDQPMRTPAGTLTSNGKFYEAAKIAALGGVAEHVRVYEKIRDGIWVFNGVFKLISAEIVKQGGRNVFKFKLELIENENELESENENKSDLSHDRLIPSHVKLEVWKRDGGKCVTCGSFDNLHFDHILPFSKGGSSLIVANIQLLCARHNLSKNNKII